MGAGGIPPSRCPPPALDTLPPPPTLFISSHRPRPQLFLARTGPAAPPRSVAFPLSHQRPLQPSPLCRRRLDRRRFSAGDLSPILTCSLCPARPGNINGPGLGRASGLTGRPGPGKTWPARPGPIPTPNEYGYVSRGQQSHDICQLSTFRTEQLPQSMRMVHPFREAGSTFVQLRLHGHPRNCTDLLRMDQYTYQTLCNTLRSRKLLEDARDISIEEQVAIFC
ncbi:hypothetical protein EJ110_NYTH02668 [Nymphaea thermarum]|nr:hypothetical protein EJ110_NYTH02668 [Nymphaea thermarum]